MTKQKYDRLMKLMDGWRARAENTDPLDKKKAMDWAMDLPFASHGRKANPFKTAEGIAPARNMAKKLTIDFFPSPQAACYAATQFVQRELSVTIGWKERGLLEEQQPHFPSNPFPIDPMGWRTAEKFYPEEHAHWNNQFRFASAVTDHMSLAVRITLRQRMGVDNIGVVPSFFGGQQPISDTNNLEQWTHHLGWTWHQGKQIFISERPSRVSFNNLDQLHSTRGPAAIWRDGFGLFALKGVTVPPEVIMAPEKMTVQRILSETNLERRRVIMEHIGYERLLREAGKMKQEDHCGKLWLIGGFAEDEDQWDRPWRPRMRGAILIVEVENSSPEPDGSFRHYFLRVPFTCRTAHEAVAWTFGLGPDQYSPERES